jgi:predicted phosphodiesterase
MSLTQQLAKVIKFNYYFLVHPVFKETIKPIKRLFTGKLPLGAMLFLLGLSIVTVEYEDSRFIRQLFPGEAEVRITKVDNKYKKEVRVFEDGAICEHTVQLAYLRRYVTTLGEVWALDPSDSSKRRTINSNEYKAYKPYDYVALCRTVEKGSTTGVLAAWRRGPGRLLKDFIDAPESSNLFPTRYLQTIFRALLLEAIFLTFFACLFISFYAPPALVRLFIILARAYSPAETEKWAIPAEPAWDPVLIQLSDTHVTAGGPPYEVVEDPKLWPHVPELNTPERLSRVFQELNSLQSKPGLVVITGDLVDLGEEAEWNELGVRIRQFFTETQAMGGWLTRIMLIPGNHDISINKGTAPDHVSDQRFARIGRCAKFICEVEREFEPDHVAQKWNDKFPYLIRTSVSATEVNILALDSTRYSSHWVLSNAVGRFGRRQLRETQERLTTCSGPLIVLTHHHISSPKRARWNIADRLMSPLKITIDGRALLQILSSYAQQEGNTVLVIHGHQHREFFEVYQPDQAGCVYIYGHPSSTMGIETDGALDGILRCAVIGLAMNGRWQIKSHGFN